MAVVDPEPARMTASEFLVAEAGDPKRNYQLIDGVVVYSQPKPRHQQACGVIFVRLHAWVAESGLGKVSLPLDIEVNGHNVYGPDVLWAADADRFKPDDFFKGLPDLIVEVRSPSTWDHDTGTKKRRYETRGLPELWLVDTDNKVALVYRRSAPEVAEFDIGLKFGADEVLTSPQLPGFELELREVFPDD